MLTVDKIMGKAVEFNVLLNGKEASKFDINTEDLQWMKYDNIKLPYRKLDESDLEFLNICCDPDY